MPRNINVLVTGGAGFIGSHVADRLLADGCEVTVVDNFDPYYDPGVKWSNIRGHLGSRRYRLVEVDIRDLAALESNLTGRFDAIIHLAAKAGVRPSLIDPIAYQQVNVIGTQNLLELARRWGVKQFVFASSSSVYGVNPGVPWREDDHVLMPISPYASTKLSGEMLGHVYSHLYGMRFVALRFFTVFGPRQRPDLAIHKIARLILEGKAVPIYGDGSSRRDYTYIDDIVEGVLRATDYEDSAYEVINLGGSRTVSLLEMVRAIEDTIGTKAIMDFRPEQPGDVPQTYADTQKASALLGFCPGTDFRAGLEQFIAWLRPCASTAHAQVA